MARYCHRALPHGALHLVTRLAERLSTPRGAAASPERSAAVHPASADSLATIPHGAAPHRTLAEHLSTLAVQLVSSKRVGAAHMTPGGHATVDQHTLLRVALRPKVRPNAIVDVPELHQSRSCHLRVPLASSASCYPGARAQQGHPGPGSTWPALRTPHSVASTSGSPPPQAPQAARAPNATSQQVGGGLPQTHPCCSPFGDANGVQLP